MHNVTRKFGQSLDKAGVSAPPPISNHRFASESSFYLFPDNPIRHSSSRCLPIFNSFHGEPLVCLVRWSPIWRRSHLDIPSAKRLSILQTWVTR